LADVRSVYYDCWAILFYLHESTRIEHKQKKNPPENEKKK
jgi:hypothetical protein